MSEALIFDAVRTPRGKGKSSGSLYTVRPVDLLATVLRSVRQDNPVNMTGLCLLGLRLQATKQLNGIPDVINCLASAYHQVYDASAGTWSYQLTRNPGWQATDLLKRRGTKTMLADARIDLDAFAAWASAKDFYLVMTDAPGDASWPIAATGTVS